MEAFQESCASPMDFGTTFLRVDFLSVYAIYCTSYARGNECLEKSLGENENLRDFIEVSKNWEDFVLYCTPNIDMLLITFTMILFTMSSNVSE